MVRPIWIFLFFSHTHLLISFLMPSVLHAQCDAVGVRNLCGCVDDCGWKALRVCANGTPSMLFYVTRCSVHIYTQTHSGKHIRLRINDDHCAIQLLINLISYSNVHYIMVGRVHLQLAAERVPGSRHYRPH
jgi:hypothetical protein